MTALGNFIYMYIYHQRLPKHFDEILVIYLVQMKPVIITCKLLKVYSTSFVVWLRTAQPPIYARPMTVAAQTFDMLIDQD